MIDVNYVQDTVREWEAAEDGPTTTTAPGSTPEGNIRRFARWRDELLPIHRDALTHGFRESAHTYSTAIAYLDGAIARAERRIAR